MKINAHKLIAKTAESMAEAVFEEAMSRDNQLYRALRANHPGKSVKFIRRLFIEKLAPRLVETARMQLIDMLTRDDVDETAKREIYDAILADAAIPRGETVQ